MVRSSLTPAPIAPISPCAFSSSSARKPLDAELGEIGVHLGVGLVMPPVEIVDDQDVDPRHAEALEAVLIGAHDAVIGVVPFDIEGEAAGPHAVVEGFGVGRRLEDAADLGREHHLFSGAMVERPANPVLALPAAVPRRGVVVADAGVPGGGKGRIGLGLGDLREQVAERRAAEPELRHHDVGAPKLAPLKWIHRLPPLFTRWSRTCCRRVLLIFRPIRNGVCLAQDQACGPASFHPAGLAGAGQISKLACKRSERGNFDAASNSTCFCGPASSRKSTFRCSRRSRRAGYDGAELPIFGGTPGGLRHVGRELKNTGLRATAVCVIPDKEHDCTSSRPEGAGCRAFPSQMGDRLP